MTPFAQHRAHTLFSDVATVHVTREQALSAGGGHIRTKLNLVSLITEGDESQNVLLFVRDVVCVDKSDVVLLDQLLKAGQSIFSSQFVQVSVSGRVLQSGGVTLHQARL